MLTRRAFLQLSVTSAGSFLIARFGAGRAFAIPLPGGTLDPRSIPKYVDAAGHPAGDAAHATASAATAKRIDYYEIAVRQFSSRSCRPGCPTTTVWGYGSVNHPGTFNYPAFTIEATWRSAGAGQVDQRPGRRRTATSCRTCCRSTRRCTGRTRPAAPRRGQRTVSSTPGPVPGPVPIVTHLHGGAQRPRRATATPRRGTCPRRATSRRATRRSGTLLRRLQGQVPARSASAWDAGQRDLPVPTTTSRAATLWYHDHTLGMTRLNVYAGPAGFYLLRGGPGDAVGGTLPGPGAGARRPAGTQLLRDPARDPGPLVQRGRLAVLPGQPRASSTASPGPLRSREQRHLADLEPGVLRQHDGGQRQHLARTSRSSRAATASAS